MGWDGTKAVDPSDLPKARIRNCEVVPKATGSSCGLETLDLTEPGFAEGGSGSRSTAANTTNPIKIQIRHQVDFSCLTLLYSPAYNNQGEAVLYIGISVIAQPGLRDLDDAWWE